MRECSAIHNIDMVIRELVKELPKILEELFIEEQDSSIQRGVYLTPYFGEELLSLN